MSIRKPAAPLDPLACPMAELVRLAARAGVEFRLRGCEVELRETAQLDPMLLVALHERGDALWLHLGGVPADPDCTLEICYPQTEREAQDAIDSLRIMAKSRMPYELRDAIPPWLGFDTETAADPGQDNRPAIKIKKDGYPAKAQPALLETAGLDPHRSHIRLLQFCAGGDTVLVFDTDLLPSTLLEPLIYCHTLLIHNAGFDLRFLQRAGFDIDRIHFEDAMQAARLLFGAGNSSLDAVALKMLGMTLPKGLQRSAWHAPHLSHAQIQYAAQDAAIVRTVWSALRRLLVANNRGEAYVLQRDVTRAAVRMVERGVTLDRTAHAALVEDWAWQHSVAIEEFTEATNEPVPETPDQLRTYLAKVLPPPTLAQWNVTKKTGELSTRSSDLKRVAHLPGVRELLKVSAFAKLRNSFGATLVDKISPVDHLLHPSYNVASTKTGRASSNNPNVQQLPRDDKAAGFRSCIRARPGYVLIAGDFSQMELRAAAHISGDKQMTADYANGIDIHQQLAASILGIPYAKVSKQQRQGAKAISFGTIFGAGPRGIAATAWSSYGVEMSYDEAAKALNLFFNRYPEFYSWMRRHHQECVLSGVIRIGRLGRVIEAAWETPKALAKAASDPDEDVDIDTSYAATQSLIRPGDVLRYTLACNAPIQGACADATMLALLGIDRVLQDSPAIDADVVLCIHDEIVVESLAEHVQYAASMLQIEMIRAFSATFPGAPTTGLVEIGSGETWAAAKP